MATRRIGIIMHGVTAWPASVKGAVTVFELRARG